MTAKTLKPLDILTIGLATFALFAGSGNLIFPPIVGLRSGVNAWPSLFGFLLTSVGMPLITIITVVAVRGGIETLTRPVGRKFSLILAFVCYLSIGPLYIMPRTATVSYGLAVVPFWGDKPLYLLGFSFVYFALTCLISFRPHKMVHIVGTFLAPIKIISFFILGASAFLFPVGRAIVSSDSFINTHPVAYGAVNGYQTMDTFASMAFGVLLMGTLRARGIHEHRSQVKYITIAGLIACVLMTSLYFGLFRLGQGMGSLTPDAQTGDIILAAFTRHTFGLGGSIFLGGLVFLTCLVTSVGVTTACSTFFSEHLGIGYRTVLFVSLLFSFAIANIGLSGIIQISIPVLICIYPPSIMVVFLNIIRRLMRHPPRVFIPVVYVASLMGLIDGLKASPLKAFLPGWTSHLPLASTGMSWIIPTIPVLVLALLADRLAPRPKKGVEDAPSTP